MEFNQYSRGGKPMNRINRDEPNNEEKSLDEKINAIAKILANQARAGIIIAQALERIEGKIDRIIEGSS